MVATCMRGKLGDSFSLHSGEVMLKILFDGFIASPKPLVLYLRINASLERV